MMRYISIAFMVISLITNVHAEGNYKKFGNGRVVFSEQDLTIEVEVGTTSMQRAIGLMHREYMAANRGMLFVFEQEAIQRVWMKDTLIPLDILFISSQGEIVSILKNVVPCIKSPCDIYKSEGSAKYMLEINAWMSDRENIKTGQKLLFFLE